MFIDVEPQIWTMTSRPFEAVSVDLGYLNGTHYLVLMDRYSGWPLVKPLKKLDTAFVTSTLEDWFLDYGKPVSSGPMVAHNSGKTLPNGVRNKTSSTSSHRLTIMSPMATQKWVYER